MTTRMMLYISGRSLRCMNDEGDLDVASVFDERQSASCRGYDQRAVARAKARHQAARDSLASAVSEEIQASRELSEAMLQWEHEFFAREAGQPALKLW